MIRLTTENTQKAIAERKPLKPRARYIKDRLFVVYSSNNSNIYHVRDYQTNRLFSVGRADRCESLLAENQKN